MNNFLPKIKVYLDDERIPPDGWVHVKSPNEVIDLLKTGSVIEMSLDHDLGGDDTIGTGYDVLCWLEEQVICNHFFPPFITIHSANPSAKNKMLLALDTINRYRHRMLG